MKYKQHLEVREVSEWKPFVPDAATPEEKLEIALVALRAIATRLPSVTYNISTDIRIHTAENALKAIDNPPSA